MNPVGIETILFRPFFHRIGISRKEFARDTGMLTMQPGKGISQEINDRSLPGTDADTASQFQLIIVDFGFSLANEGQDFFGPLPEMDSFLCQVGIAVGPDEELFT